MILDMETNIPECLTIACDRAQLDEVHRWWESLADESRADFLAIATIDPESLGTSGPLNADDDSSEYAEWYEYIINQDVRFYFDRSNPQGDGLFKIVYPTIAPISASADAFVVSQLLSRPVGR